MATLIAQASSDSSIKNDLEEQLKIWNQTDSIRYISPERIKIYRLLSGDVNVVAEYDLFFIYHNYYFL